MTACNQGSGFPGQLVETQQRLNFGNAGNLFERAETSFDRQVEFKSGTE